MRNGKPKVTLSSNNLLSVMGECVYAARNHNWTEQQISQFVREYKDANTHTEKNFIARKYFDLKVKKK